jgi:hypothetical protein
MSANDFTKQELDVILSALTNVSSVDAKRAVAQEIRWQCRRMEPVVIADSGKILEKLGYTNLRREEQEQEPEA